jgi:molybdopterin synthase sulfur carrier subunit
MIQIDLKLFVTLAQYLPPGSEAYDIKEGTTVDDLMTDLGIPPDIVKLIFINGKKQDREYCIQHKDRVGMFPPVGGG